MKKRLRKKKRVGEFEELGFHIGFVWDQHLSQAGRNALLDRFILDAIEQNGLQFGGGGASNVWTGFCASAKRRGSATEADRRAVQSWFEQESQVLRYHIGPLVDAWFGDFEKQEEVVRKTLQTVAGRKLTLPAT